MLNAAVAALACLCLARCSPAQSHAMRTYMKTPYTAKDLGAVLTNIEEKLRVLDIISSVQAKQSRRLEVLQDKLDRVETTMSLRLERAQLAADRLEHRLHMLQTSVQASIKENNEKVLKSQLKIAELTQNLTKDIDGHRRLLEKASIKENNEKVLKSQLKIAELTQNLTKDIDGHRRLLEKASIKENNEKVLKSQLKIAELTQNLTKDIDGHRRLLEKASIKENNEKVLKSQLKIAELTQNLTKDIDGHRRLLEKVNGAYSDTWRRSLLLENMMRDGLTLVNATRRELADGLRGLARRKSDERLNSAELEANFARQIKDNTYMIDVKLRKVLDAQKRFLDSCQRVQQDDPTHVADVLDKLIDSLINKTAATFKELQNIQVTVRNHDARVMKLLSLKTTQTDASCRRLEHSFKNASQSTFKETELQQLTEKFVALTDRADAALQRLEAKMETMATSAEEGHTSDFNSEADRLMLKLKGIKNEYDSDEDLTWEEYNPKYRNGWNDDDVGDLMDKDKELLSVRKGRQVKTSPDAHGPAHSPNSSKPRPPAPTRPPHRRHLHKHPYDRGPSRATHN